MHSNPGGLLLAALALLSPALARAQLPARPVPVPTPAPANGSTADLGSALAALGGDPTAALAGSFRGLVLAHLPSPLYEDLSQWGMKKQFPGRVRWIGRGLRTQAVVEPEWKNDGHWKMLRVTAIRPQDTLVLSLRDVEKPEPGRMLFTVFVAMDTHVEHDQQVWRQGVRFRSSGMRARMRVQATLRCEVISKMDRTAGLVPDLVFRMRVLAASVGYDNLVVEHVAGLGGDAARVLGGTVFGMIKGLRPSLEKNLLAKANEAIVKKGDTKEIRISLLDLMNKGASPISKPGKR